MDKLCYKSFVWPRNPHTYRETRLREPQYVTEKKVTQFTGMGERKLVISGSGVFFGADAFRQFQELAALFEEKTAGELAHPVWGKRYCYFTALEMTQEPRDNYVSYSFTFTAALDSGEIPK